MTLVYCRSTQIKKTFSISDLISHIVYLAKHLPPIEIDFVTFPEPGSGSDTDKVFDIVNCEKKLETVNPDWEGGGVGSLVCEEQSINIIIMLC